MNVYGKLKWVTNYFITLVFQQSQINIKALPLKLCML